MKESDKEGIQDNKESKRRKKKKKMRKEEWNKWRRVQRDEWGTRKERKPKIMKERGKEEILN